MPTWGKVLLYLAITALIASVFYNIWLGTLLAALTAGPGQEVYAPGDKDHTILVLPIEGNITNDTDAFVRRALRFVREQEPKALILRVDSPGGSPFACDRIANKLGRLRSDLEIPIVASYGGYAASGGYYVSAGADRILAEPNTITGSIGVVTVFLNIKGLLEDRLSIKPHVEVARESPRKLEGTHPFRYDEEDQEAMLNLLDHLHESFVRVVRDGRGEAIDDDDFADVTSGAAFTANAARQLGLIDDIGYLDDAVKVAKELAEIPEEIDAHVVFIRPPRTLLGLLFGASMEQEKPASFDGEKVREWMLEATGMRFEYRWYPGH